MAGGRPTLLTAERLARMRELRAMGHNNAGVAAEAGICASTLMNWLARGRRARRARSSDPADALYIELADGWAHWREVAISRAEVLLSKDPRTAWRWLERHSLAWRRGSAEYQARVDIAKLRMKGTGGKSATVVVDPGQLTVEEWAERYGSDECDTQESGE